MGLKFWFTCRFQIYTRKNFLELFIKKKYIPFKNPQFPPYKLTSYTLRSILETPQTQSFDLKFSKKPLIYIFHT